MPYYGVSPNLTFLHQKMQSRKNALGLPLRGLDEHPSHTHVSYAGYIIAPVALPKNPYVPGRGNARGHSSGWVGDGPREGLAGDHGLTGNRPT